MLGIARNLKTNEDRIIVPKKPTSKIQIQMDTEVYTLFVAYVGVKADADWVIDSGASRHMTFQKNTIRDYTKNLKLLKLLNSLHSVMVVRWMLWGQAQHPSYLVGRKQWYG